MIKRLLYCLCAVLSASYVQAQDFQFGVRLGANYASVWNAKEATVGSVLGPQAGLISNVKLNSRQTIQAEVLYSGKGFTQTVTRKSSGTTTVTDYSTRLNYLELPVMYQHFFSKSKHSRYYDRVKPNGFFVTGGPQISALVGASTTAKQTVTTTETENSSKESVGMSQYVNNFDVSLVAGAGYRFTNSTTVSVRYAAGLRKIADVSNPVLPATARNSALQVSVAYLLPHTF
ncbi:MAG: PorT family protein [Hymenobacteraceae bacterium]|nr:PorT family protein [Hymenobacteraceae bacterium]MDX5397341.1 PorT family protein [Hymenobacteraceae bacterium]MDX5443638.1 PorT family protein [Hymenobacteraceae bacterium]MDX5513420.1 PorT family protein [Hymenobacteraceae bacterium]